MTTITISLSDDQAAQLSRNAERLGTTPQQLIQATAETLAADSKSAMQVLEHKLKVQEAVNFVIQKHDELLRRLA